MHKNRFTRVGFILAAAGSAVGLGNIWKFPYITGENGGGVFVLVYLATVFFIGMAIFIGEVLLGSNSNHNAVLCCCNCMDFQLYSNFGDFFTYKFQRI